MKKQIGLIVFFIFFGLNVWSQEVVNTIRVACVGNSITFGAGIANRDRDSYPSVLGQMLGRGYEVRNFGFSARTMLMKGDHPYMKEQMFQEALQYNPNIVVIKLGTNDSKPFNWKHKADFQSDMQAMVNAFNAIPSKPKIYLCYPAKAYLLQYGINDSIIVNGVIPVIDRVAKQNKLPIIDLHTSTSGMEANFPDKIHPDPIGAHKIAETVYRAITGKESEHCMQAFPGFKSEWNGGDRYDFRFKGRDAIVVVPKQAAEGNPWIWRPAFFDAFPSVDKALLEKGFHIVYYDVTHCYGNPRAVEQGTDFYRYMKDYYGLSSKVTLEGFSRGGLYALNWAARNTDKIACIYLDAPVCNVFSWPGREKRPDHWQDLLNEWQLTDEAMKTFKGNPIDNLEPLAKADIPIIGVCGDADKVVPYEENMAIVRARYLALGGRVEIILKPGVDHHPHSLENPEPVVDFILRHQPGYERFLHYNVRGSLQNSFVKFEKERKARVAFLGGSITEMNGWKNLIEQQLKQRFPYTEFEFIEAGIGSTGSTPGAFRLQHDVLSKGKVDLLFVEAAVNDHTNYFTPLEQVRGMEGEVRHALLSNPEMDIVMLHFIYDPFIPMVAKKQVPDVLLNHERVANHYLIPSVNLVSEIGERMQAGEFTWEQFGGTHPSPFGHKYYAAAINHLFDAMWRNVTPDMPVKAHELPMPLDANSYYNGDFIELKAAKLNKGWKYIPSWRAENKYEKRNGFVDVPMLEATHPGDKLTLHFTGKAIGIFCTPGPTAGIIEYRVDGAPYKKLDTYTEWSKYLYIPWVYMLETDLNNTEHKLELRISKEKNSDSIGTECQIRYFVVNR